MNRNLHIRYRFYLLYTSCHFRFRWSCRTYPKTHMDFCTIYTQASSFCKPTPGSLLQHLGYLYHRQHTGEPHSRLLYTRHTHLLLFAPGYTMLTFSLWMGSYIVYTSWTINTYIKYQSNCVQNQTKRHIYQQYEIQTDRQTDIHTDRQTGRQADRQTDSVFLHSIVDKSCYFANIIP